MIASSAFVLAALTMTGVYMQSKDQESQYDGYTIDFSALENSVDDKSQEIAQNFEDFTSLEDDLDYASMEAGSNDIEIPGLTDKEKDEGKDVGTDEGKDENKNVVVNQQTGTGVPTESTEAVTDTRTTEGTEGTATEAPQGQEVALANESPVIVQELHYATSEGLTRPLSGATLIPFSMEKSVYFTTLDQYKRNNALIISAKEGTAVKACAEGKVVDIFQNEEIGHAITMELGDGYRLTYGQLRDIQVAVGSYVNSGDTIGTVATPTKYYVREGSNLYLQMTADGKPVNPEALFQ